MTIPKRLRLPVSAAPEAPEADSPYCSSAKAIFRFSASRVVDDAVVDGLAEVVVRNRLAGAGDVDAAGLVADGSVLRPLP